jgi:selenophosphate synthetase-related protein
MKVRPQNYPTLDEMSDENELPKPKTRKESYGAAAKAALNSYREGQLVTLSKRGFDATVIQVTGDSILVLDSDGIIHACRPHEVYHSQAVDALR